MDFYKKWWFWLVVLVIFLVIFFFPKSCGGVGGIGWTSSTSCSCVGFNGHTELLDYTSTSCYGICLKNTCKTETTGIYPNGSSFVITSNS